MEILTSEQMRRVDRYAIETLGIAGLLLMESAGHGIAAALQRDYGALVRGGVVVLCGKGNNGGDGLVAARHLHRAGVSVRVLLLAEARALQGDAAINLRAARGSGVEVVEIPDAAAWSRESASVAASRLVLDAMLGTGIRGGARGLSAEVIAFVNASDATVVAVDLPSGLDGDVGSVAGPAVRARHTYTLCRPKVPIAMGPATELVGSWSVVPIGIPHEAVRAAGAELEWLDSATAALLLPERPRDAHKGTFGHLLAVAGSRGKSGAAVLVGRAALRAGAGLVTLATAESSLPPVASQQAELMTEPLPETETGGLAKRAGRRALELLESRDALAVGPGLGIESETRSAVLTLLAERRCAAVVDADALNALAKGGSRAVDRARLPGQPWVVTPHPGEAARLLEISTGAVQSDRAAAARELAGRTGAVAVLKGNRTLIAAPDGRLSVNSSGNPGMATAGTGDVLTGIIGAFLAAGLAPRDAARLGVYVHGDAGDRAAALRGAAGTIASDLLEQLPEALAELATEEIGLEG